MEHIKDILERLGTGFSGKIPLAGFCSTGEPIWLNPSDFGGEFYDQSETDLRLLLGFYIRFPESCSDETQQEAFLVVSPDRRSLDQYLELAESPVVLISVSRVQSLDLAGAIDLPDSSRRSYLRVCGKKSAVLRVLEVNRASAQNLVYAWCARTGFEDVSIAGLLAEMTQTALNQG